MGLVQFSSVAQLCLTLCNPMDCSTGLPVHHQLPEFTQTQVHWVRDAIQPSVSSSVSSLLLPLIFPSIRIFSNESVLCKKWPKYWCFSFSMSFNEYSELISFRIDWLDLLAVQETFKSLPQHHSLKALSLVYIQFSHLTWLLEFIYLGIFHSNCAIVHNAAINTSVHIFLYKFRSYFETWT